MIGRRVKTKIDAETVDEIEFHIEMRTKQYEEEGHEPAEARRRALEHFGDPAAVDRRIAAVRERRGSGRKWARAGLVAAGVAVLLLVLAASGAFDQTYYRITGEYPKLAPYAAIRWDGTTPEIELEGKWYRLLDVDHVKAESIVSFCQGRWPRIWKKRFEEDLVEAMSRMGRPPSERVDLVVEDPVSGEQVLKMQVPMTAGNRIRIWHAANQGELR